MDQTCRFVVEELGDGHYRATLDDNFVTWGYGDTPWEAISELCLEMEDVEANESKQE